MAGGATESGRTVTSKVTAILMAFSRGSTHSLTELATLTGLPVSTTHRLANELTARRLLERTDDGGYRVGLPLRMIGGRTAPTPGPAGDPAAPTLAPAGDPAAPTLAPAGDPAAPTLGPANNRSPSTLGPANNPPPSTLAPAGHPSTPMVGPAGGLGVDRPAPEPIWDRALAAMTDLALATRSCVRLGLLDGTSVLERHVRPGAPPSPVVLSPRPADTTALGRVLLAFSPPAVVEQVLAGRRLPDGLRRSLATIRLSHVATVRGGVAMPVFGAGGTVLGALELTDPSTGARAALVVVTGSLSRTLATRPEPVQAVAYHS